MQKHTLSIECFEQGGTALVRVSKEYVNDAGQGTTSEPLVVTPHTAAHLIEEMAGSMAQALRLQSGMGVYRG
jgi:hypothetical protein